MLGAMLIGFIGAMLMPAAQGETNAIRIAGQLTKIEGKVLTITADGKDTVITCNDATKIGRDGGKATFGDLQVGLPVRAYYSKTDSVASAVFIAKAPENTKP